MSDTMISEPQQGGQVPSEGGGDRRKLLMIGGAVVGLLVLGMAVYFLFLSGGSSDEDALAPVAKGTPPATSDEGDKGGGGKDDDADKAPKNQTVQVGRDPFAPLAVEAPKPEPKVDSTDTGTDDQSTQTDTTVTPAPTPTDNTSQTTSYSVTLQSVDVKKGQATIEVNGARYVVKVNDLFTNADTGPFELTWVGERANGTAVAKVVFGSDAPVELVEKDPVLFEA